MATPSHLAPPNPPHFYTPTYGYLDAFARKLVFSIGAEEPATIVYTTDGSTPGAGSPRGASPVRLLLDTDGTQLRWYADNGVAEPAHAANVQIDARLQTYYGYLVDVADLGGGGPVAVVSPGATVSGTANWQGWTSPACPSCRYQVIYGVGATSMGCLYDGAVGAWPGSSGLGAAFTVTAPSVAGLYKVNVTYDLQLSCANAVAKASLGVRPTETIAWIVVK